MSSTPSRKTGATSYFIDEDCWQIALADRYTARGTLWRVAEGPISPMYDLQIPSLGTEARYDLINGRYIVSGMHDEEKEPLQFGFISSAGIRWQLLHSGPQACSFAALRGGFFGYIPVICCMAADP